jgi:hypothetical protein
MTMRDNIAIINKISKRYDKLNRFTALNEISAFYDRVKGSTPPALLEMNAQVSKLNAFYELVNPFRAILDDNILIKSNINQLIKDISPFSSSLSILNQLSSSYGDIIFKQKEAFVQISYLQSYEKRYLLRHEYNQKKALIVDSDDFENADTIRFNVANTIGFVNSLGNLDNQDTDSADVADSIESELNEALKSHGRGYLEVLEGAKQAAAGDNPDKVRHTVTSLRELSTRILHDLSPDKQVEKWTTKKEDYVDGRPTRKCRIAYIFRNVTHSNAGPLIENDIKFTADLFGFFNKGTHELIPALSANDLRYLIYKFESTILLLLKYSSEK